MVEDRDGKQTDLLCLVCDEPIKLAKYIVANYKGEVVCQKCKSVLHLKLAYSQVAEYRIVKDKTAETAAMETIRRLREAYEK